MWSDAAATRFAGLTAIVTGASQGIGLAIAEQLCSRGATVALVARDANRLQIAATAIGPRALPLALDLTQESSLTALVEDMRTTLPRLDILVHAAGSFVSGTLEETSLEQLDRLFAINLRAPHALTRLALPLLRASQGQVVFINSSVVQAARLDRRGAYAATKFALKAIADSLRDELNPEGVRVMSVYPGSTATPMQAQLHADAGRVYAPERLLQPLDVALAVCAALELPRTAEATDIHVRPMRAVSAS